MMRNFLDRYLPLYQAPDAPSGGAPAPSSDTGPSSSPGPGSPSGGGSSTSSSPSTEAQPSVGTEDFSYIFGSGEAETPQPAASGLPQPETPPVQPQPQPQPTPAAPQPPAEAPKPGQPAPSTPATAAPATTEPAPSAQLDPYDPGALATALQQNEAAAIQHIADTMFKLTPEEAEALETDTVGTVSKLLAKTLVMSQRNMLNTMSRLLGPMIQRHQAVTKKQDESEAKFYAAWPQIDKAKHGELVTRLGTQYRRMNPEASFDQMVAELGPYIMMVAKIDPNARPGAQPAAPAASPMVNGFRPPQPAPFVPAGPGSGGASPQSQVVLTPVESMFNPPDQ